MLLELFEPAFEFTVGNSSVPTMIAFVSDTCPHCAAVKPHLSALDDQYRPKVSTWIINVARAPNLAPFYFEGVPVLMGFHQGQPLWRQVGAPEPSVLAKMYEDLAGRGAQPTWSGAKG